MELRWFILPSLLALQLNDSWAESLLPHNLRRFLFGGADVFESPPASCEYPVKPRLDYPHTHLDAFLVRNILNITRGPGLWLELGSFFGNSAILTAEQIKAMALSTTVLCVDPFTGDTNMWTWRYQRVLDSTVADGYDFFAADSRGHAQIYEVFLANVRHASHDDIIIPLQATSIVGLRLVQRMVRDGILPRRPQVIYLDSAHEPDEVILEARVAWATLSRDAVLFGDDYDWEPVHDDVLMFAKELRLPLLPQRHVRRFDTPVYRAEQPVPGLVVVGRHWLLYKPKSAALVQAEPNWWEAPLPEGYRYRRKSDTVGNPRCWEGTFSFLMCCHELFGPEGNFRCWSGDFNYDFCCR